MLEVLVAVAVSTVLFGICVAMFLQVSRYKSRNEGLLLIEETARGAFDRLERDLTGLHVADSDGDGSVLLTDYWRLEKAPVAGCSGDRLMLLSAVENPGRLDYCTVSYYVKDGRLYRRLSSDLGGEAPTGGWPAESASALAENVNRLVAIPAPAAPADGRLPETLTFTLEMKDAGSAAGVRRFTLVLRPGAEEH
jgi:type II secretory pathway component PulJ